MQIVPVLIKMIILPHTKLIVQIPSTGLKETLVPEGMHIVMIMLLELATSIEESIRSSNTQDTGNYPIQHLIFSNSIFIIEPYVRFFLIV